MNIFKNFKKKQDKIIFWSTIEGLEEVAPPQPLKNFIPEWFKAIKPSSMDDYSRGGTVKDCPSFMDVFSNGFVVPMWCDLEIKVEDKGKEGTTWNAKYPSKIFSFTSHPDIQFKDHIPQHEKEKIKCVFKPDCPWRIKTPPGWSCWQFPMWWHYNQDFETMQGVIRTDTHHEINQQMLLKREGIIHIPRGTPLAFYVPFERKKLELEIRPSNDPEARRWNTSSNISLNTKFKKSYLIRSNNEAKKREESTKCPFFKS